MKLIIAEIIGVCLIVGFTAGYLVGENSVKEIQQKIMSPVAEQDNTSRNEYYTKYMLTQCLLKLKEAK